MLWGVQMLWMFVPQLSSSRVRAGRPEVRGTHVALVTQAQAVCGLPKRRTPLLSCTHVSLRL